MAYDRVRYGGHVFFFKLDSDDDDSLYHITARHKTLPIQAIEVFFSCTEDRWNAAFARFESRWNGLVLYWCWWGNNGEELGNVLVITCFKE